MRRSAVVIVVALAALLLGTVPASAGPPPKGLYECTIGELLFDDIRIKSDNKYERFEKVGKFGSKGRKLNFTSGPLKGFKGRWYMANEGNAKVPEIALKNPLDDFESIYCSK